MLTEKRICDLFLFIVLITLSVAPLGAEGKMLLPGVPTYYPTPYWNIVGATSTVHIFVGGLPIATIEKVGTGTPKLLWNYADHLGSTKIVTSDMGQVEERVSYDAFGSHISSLGGNGYAEQRKFTGHEFDPSTNYTYAKARYLDTDAGRFLSEDPAFWSLPSELLTDPQQMNSYAYARNNPLRYVDPDGKLNVIIGGTWGKEWTDWESNSAMKNFVNGVANTFGSAGGGMAKTQVEALPELRDNAASRASTADRIASMINGYDFAEGETLNIVGHSHGGNVAALLSNMLDRKIDNMVTLGTPVRGDYVFNESNIGNHVNAYSTKDFIQQTGGGWLSGSGVLGTLFGFSNGGVGGSMIGGRFGNLFGWGEFGLAGQKFNSPNVSDVDVTNEAGGNGRTAHSNLWKSPSVWQKISNESF